MRPALDPHGGEHGHDEGPQHRQGEEDDGEALGALRLRECEHLPRRQGEGRQERRAESEEERIQEDGEESSEENGARSDEEERPPRWQREEERG